jgi:putative transposase
MSTVGHSPTEVSDAPWEVLQLLLPPPQWRPGGPGRKPMDWRRVLNGIFSVNKTGGQWRMMPQEIGNGHTISGSVRRWRQAGVWGRVMDTLHQWERQSQGRRPAPSACCADSQSIKTTTHGENVGFDGHKKSKGRQRHILVATLGLIVAVVITAAHTADRQGLVALAAPASAADRARQANTADRQGLVALGHRYVASGVTRRRKSWVDRGDDAQWLCDWIRGLKRTHKVDLEVVEQTGKGFQGVPDRWVVERTCAWVRNDRRHSRDYEVLTVSSEAMIQASMIRLLLKRLI